jgi:Uma2 family endonuclease
MTQTAHRTATYEDLLAVPEPLVAEILFGRLVTQPRFFPRHAAAVTALSGVLGHHFLFRRGRPEAWIFLYRPEVHLGPHVVVPDLAAWRRERLTPFPEADWIDTAPDWVCEVLSPETEARDRGEKGTVYAKAGVRHLWLVDPRPQILETFEFKDGKWVLLDLFRDEAQVAAHPFVEVAFPLGLLWPLDVAPPAQDETK